MKALFCDETNKQQIFLLQMQSLGFLVTPYSILSVRTKAFTKLGYSSKKASSLKLIIRTCKNKQIISGLSYAIGFNWRQPFALTVYGVCEIDFGLSTCFIYRYNRLRLSCRDSLALYSQQYLSSLQRLYLYL